MARRHHNGYAIPRALGAGLLGTSFSATVILSGVLDPLSVIGSAIVAAGAGWVVILAFAPWRVVALERRNRRRITAMGNRLHRALREDCPLEDILAAGANDPSGDEIAALARAAQDMLHEVASSRATVRRLERRMGDRIRHETHRQTARLKRAAYTDPLTGLGNRRAFGQRVNVLVKDPELFGPVSALLLDMDRFKRVNDTLGHAVGDECLVFLGELLRTSLRGGDTAVRLGGDEFLVLMPEQGLEDARPVAERLRRLFLQMPWPHRDVPRPGLSIGIAELPVDQLADGRTLLRRADEALYEAKRTGRGRVVAWAEAS